MCVGRVRTSHAAALVGHRNCVWLPFIAPRVNASVGSLRGVLPLPLVGKALARPRCIGTRVFKGNPGDRLVLPARWIRAAPPIAQKIQIVTRMVARRIQKTLELG